MTNNINSQEKIHNLKKSALINVQILIFREIIIKLLSFFAQVVLARILTPENFGIFAIVAFVVNVFDLFTDIGLTLAIIQRKNDSTQKELSSIFFIRFALCLFVIVLIFFLSPLFKTFYPSLTNENIWMIRIFSLVIIIKPWYTTIIAILERKLKYELISKADIVGVVLYYVFAILFAVNGLKVWSFIYAIFIKEISQLLLVYFYNPWLPRLHFQYKDIRDYLKFGLYVQSGSIVAFLHNSIAPVLVGTRIGPYQLGLLDWSNKLASFPKNIGDNYGRVAFATFSKIKNQEQELINLINKSLIILNIFVFYFALIVFGLGNDIVRIFFTDKWIEGIPSLYIFTLAMIINTMVTPIVQAILASGKSKELFKFNVILTIGEWLIALVLLSFLGFVSIPIANLLAATLGFLGYSLILSNRAIFFSFIKMVLIKSLIISLIVIPLNIYIIFVDNTIYTFCFKFLLLTILYILLLLVFSRKDFFILIRLLLSFNFLKFR